MTETRSELTAILFWWKKNMTDQKNGGFFGRMDGSGKIHPEAEKGVVLNARILWTFSAAARATGEKTWAESAKRAFDYLSKKFWDPKNGGVFWSVDFRGRPLQTKKQVYAQAFAVYAFSEYFRLTGDAKSFRLAIELFDLLEKNALDPHQNGYFEAYSHDWELLADLRLSEKDANEAKTQNTHLHLLEAYANLLRAVPRNSMPGGTGGAFAELGPRVQKALENLIGLFLEKFIDPKTGHIHLFLDENWAIKSDTVSFGHDIEASWLIWDAAQTTGNQQLIEKVRPVCLRIAEVTLDEATEADGSVINEFWRGEDRRDTDRIWWVQAEAMLGFWNAFEISGDEKYATAAHTVWGYTKEKMRDPAGGEWFWRVSAAGKTYEEEDKAGFWKCPYHNGRAMIRFFEITG